MSLGFTADTWVAVNAAIALRHSGERAVGWWHSHPSRHWALGTDACERQQGAHEPQFFSIDDENVHRVAFYARCRRAR